VIEYDILQSPYEKARIKRCLDNNFPIPEEILNKPELLPGLEIYIDAFNELRRFFSPDTKISWGCLNEFCNQSNIVGATRNKMFHYIPSMDRVYMKIMNDLIEKNHRANQESANG